MVKTHFTTHPKQTLPYKSIDNQVIKENVSDIESQPKNLISSNLNCDLVSMEIYKIVNVRHSLKNMSDTQFENFLPGFCDNLVDYGFDKIIQKFQWKFPLNNFTFILFLNIFHVTITFRTAYLDFCKWSY